MTAFLKKSSHSGETETKMKRDRRLEEFLEEYDPYKYKNPLM